MSQELTEKVARAICEASSETWREPPFNHLHTDALNNHWRYKARAALAVVREEMREAELLGLGRWRLGTRVTKIKGSSWTGHVVGYYRTKLTPVGYCVESETETGSVQLYPAAALRASPLGEQ